MTDNEKRAHDIAIITAKMFIENNPKKYKKLIPEKLNEDFTIRYDSAYKQALSLLREL